MKPKWGDREALGGLEAMRMPCEANDPTIIKEKTAKVALKSYCRRTMMVVRLPPKPRCQMKPFSVRAIALAVCLLGLTLISAQSQESYLLRSNGTVRVNGITVPGTAMVSAGDLIETSNGSVARISAPGVSMFVGENSKVSVKSGFLALDQGAAAITSRSGVLTGASQYSFSPVGTGSARYQIANVDGSLSVFSKAGGLQIAGPGGGSSLLSGQKATLSSSSTGDSARSNFTELDTSQRTFNQLVVPATSNLCKTAKSCYCRTAKNCPNQ